MKNKKIFLAGAITLVVGITVFMGGFAMMDFDYKKLSTDPPYAEKSYEAKTALSGISVQDNNVDINLTPSQDGKVRVIYYENEKRYYDIHEENGILSIDKKEARSWMDMVFNFSFFTPTLNIEVPADFGGELSLKTSNAGVTTEGIKAKNGKFRTSNNKIKVEDCLFTEGLTAESSNGSISLDEIDAKEIIYCRSSNSRIELSSITCQSLDAATENGGMTLDGVNADKGITAVTSNNSIVLAGVSFGTELNCKASNGGIRGDISGSLGDFSFDCKTSNGSCNLPENLVGGKKMVKLHTSNSNINVEIK